MRTSIPTAILTVACSLFSTSSDLRAECHPPLDCTNAPAWHEGAQYKKGDRVISVRGNLWECKAGSATHLCDDGGHEPDIDAAASDAWTLVQTCFVVEYPEVRTAEVFVSTAQCNGSVTLSAIIANDSPFGGATIPVAFYHSASKTLIGVSQVELLPGESDAALMQVNLVWNNPLPGSALITVVADDDGTGRGILFEVNEADNTLATTLQTCPSP
jgi:hypothetical protein